MMFQDYYPKKQVFVSELKDERGIPTNAICAL